MTDTPSVPAPVNAMPTYADQMLAALLTGGLLSLKVFTPVQVDTLTTAIVSIAGVIYALVAASPNHQSPIVLIMGILGRAPKAQQAQWDAALAQAEAAALAKLQPMVDAQIKARLGLLAGPVDGLANTALKDGADAAAAHLTI